MGRAPTKTYQKPHEQANLPAVKTSARLPSTGEELDAFDGVETGLENVTSRDVLIPRLAIIQKMSPQIDPAMPEFIEGAKYGDFCDTGTGDIYDSLLLIPCAYDLDFIEWTPKRSKTGPVMRHGNDASILKKTHLDDKKRNVLPNGNIIQETATWFCLNLSANGRKSFLPMASTNLKQSRKWMTLITDERLRRADGTEFTPPLYYRAWQMETVDRQNDDGAWKIWNATRGPTILELDPSKKLLEAAKAFYHQVRDGLVKGDVGDEGADNSPEAEARRHAAMQNAAM